MDKAVYEQPAAAGFRSMIRGRIQLARSALINPKSINDEAVHTARKNLKSARAGLRLLRATVGTRRYSIENTRLRDAARSISSIRDATVMLETAGRLLKNEKNPRLYKFLLNVARLLRQERSRVCSEFCSTVGL